MRRSFLQIFQTNFRFFGVVALIFSILMFVILSRRETQFFETQLGYEAKLVSQHIMSKQENFIQAMGRMAARMRHQGAYRKRGAVDAVNEWRKDAVVYVDEFVGLDELLYLDIRMQIEGATTSDDLRPLVGKNLMDYPDIRAAIEESAFSYKANFGDRPLPFFKGNLFYGVFPIASLDQIEGYLVAVIDYDRWFKDPILEQNYEVKLTSEGQVRYDHRADDRPKLTMKFFAQKLFLPGLNWSMQLRPLQSAFTREENFTPYLVLIAGIMISVLFWLYAYLQAELDKTKVKNFDAARLQDISNVVAGLAHEVNNPLAIIQGAVFQLQRLLRRGNADPERSLENADKIDRASRRIAKVMEGLKIYTHEETKEIYQIMSVKELLLAVESLCRQRLQQSGINLEIRDFTRNMSFDCLQSKVIRGVMELVNNAYDAVGDRPERWIRIEAENAAENLQISITDSGAGIPDQLRAKLMQPFFTTKDVGKGTGLGLSIAAGVARGHGGHLFLDENSQNTRFVMRIPKAHNAPSVSKVS